MNIQIITKMKQHKNLTFVSIFVSLAILPFFLYLHGSLGVDESSYMFKANSILYGSVKLQKDYYNVGMYPAFYYLLALVFLIFGKSFFAARAVAFIFNTLSAVIIFLIGKKLGNKEIGMLSSILFLIGILIPAYEVYGVMTEPFMIFFGLLGVLLFFKSERWIYLIISGILFGLSTLSKTSGGLFLAAIFVFYLLKLWIPENRTKIYLKNSIRNLFLIACGFLVPVLLGAFYFWSVGTLDSFVYSAFLFLKEYDRSFYISSLISPFLSYSIIWVLSFVSILLISYKFTTKKSKDGELFTVIWLFAFLYTFTVRQYGHYFVQILPPACLLASISLIKLYPLLSLESIKESLSKLNHLKIFAILCLLTMILSSFAYVTYDVYSTQKSRSIRLDEQLNTAEYIKAHTSPNEKILSFSYEPSIYFLSDRNPPTEFLHLDNLLSDEEYEYHVIERIKKNNVRYVTVCNDRIVNGKSTQAQHIYEFILENYKIEKSIGVFDIYKLKDEK